jgi:hypothetical protein
MSDILQHEPEELVDDITTTTNQTEDAHRRHQGDDTGSDASEMTSDDGSDDDEDPREEDEPGDENDDDGASSGGGHSPRRPADRPTTGSPPPRGAVRRVPTVTRKRPVPHPRGANAWRCKRLEPDGTRTPLYWAEDGTLETTEWAITSCTPAVIHTRWGAGEYVCEFYEITTEGRRVARGRSPVIHLRGQRSDGVSAAPPVASPPLGASLAASTGAGSDTLALVRMFEARNERMHQQLEARNERMYQQLFEQMRAQSEREIALIRASAEKTRAEAEMQSLREKLASKERIAQLQLNARGATSPELEQQLAALNESVESLREMQEQADGETATPNAAPNPAGTPPWLAQLLPHLPALMELLKANANPPSSPQVIRIERDGGPLGSNG